ncbi:MAG: SprT-like domain-containing protein [Gemmatimonadales bacterium]
MIEQLDLPLRVTADLVTRLRDCGLPRELPIELHENRRVMISFDRLGTLRIHRGYAFAPDRIIAALARWASPRHRLTRRDRRALARVFLEFPVHGHVPPVGPRRRRAEPAEPGDSERLARLGALHLMLSARWFAAALAPIEIRLSGRMRRKLGHYEPRAEGTPLIVISRRHLRHDGWSAVAGTLLHEMVHQWQDEAGLPVDHGSHFRRKAREVGITPRAMAMVLR